MSRSRDEETEAKSLGGWPEVRHLGTGAVNSDTAPPGLPRRGPCTVQPSVGEPVPPEPARRPPCLPHLRLHAQAPGPSHRSPPPYASFLGNLWRYFDRREGTLGIDRLSGFP